MESAMSVDWTIKATDVAIVFATIAGPILAVWASEWRQRRRAIHDRKEWVFRTLTTTRGAKMQPLHVEALNHIVFAFPQQSHPEVFDTWNLYHAQLSTPYGETQEEFARWTDKLDDMFSNLVHQMARDLNIPFPKSLIKSGSYHPKGFVDAEIQQAELRKFLLEVLKGDRAIPVRADNERT